MSRFESAGGANEKDTTRSSRTNKECHVDTIYKSPSLEEQRGQAAVLLAVDGMGCPNCAQRVRNGLIQGYGVVSADVDLAAGRARVVYNPVLVKPSHLAHAVAEAGAAAWHEYRAYVLS